MRSSLRYLYDKTAFDSAQPTPSYWADSAPDLPPFAPLESDRQCDVAIIGAGYTGMMAAYHLAREHGLDVCVLEAAQPGWGASGRNGGFCCMGSAKLSYSAMIRRYGLEETRRFFQIQKESVAFVGDFIEAHGIDADATGEGEICLAHKANRQRELAEEQRFLMETFGHQTQILSQEELAERGLKANFYGGLHNPVGFGLHPLKYARGLAETLRSAGIALFGDSPVTDWHEDGGWQVLRTPHASVKARQVVLATNGYTPENMTPKISGRLLPVLSNILVTRPLTEAELAAQGWTATTTTYDSRTLLHYFRLLPDGRFLFGGRGGTDASPAGRAKMERTLRAHFEKLFPAWAGIEHTHFWQGFACLANDLTPYIGPLDEDHRRWTALAYHGNGVAMGSWAGWALAQEIAGKGAKANIPAVINKRFSAFPLPALRLLYLRAAYTYYHVTDEWL